MLQLMNESRGDEGDGGDVLKVKQQIKVTNRFQQDLSLGFL